MSIFDTMPIEARMNNEVGPSNGRIDRTGLKRSSKQHQTSKQVKNKVELPSTNQCMKFRDKFKTENCFVQPQEDQHLESKQGVHNKVKVKHSGDQRRHLNRSKPSKNDELVKYMSNLPAYLQRMDRGDKHQEKALNFGVLEWERLEKWKQKQTSTPSRHSTHASSTSNASLGSNRTESSSDTVSSEFLGHDNKQQRSLGSDPDSSHAETVSNGVKPYRKKVIDALDYYPGPHSTSHGCQMLRNASKSFGGSSPVRILEKKNKKDLDQMITSETGSSPLNSRNKCVPHGSKMSCGDVDPEKNAEEFQDVDFEFPFPCYPDKLQNIVLLLPKDMPRNSFSDFSQSSEPRPSTDQKMMNFNRRSFSDAFSSQKSHPAEQHSEVPHSCPLPCGDEISTQGMEHLSGACKASKHSKTKLLDASVTDTVRRLDGEFADAVATKGSSSPNRRFGFGKMSRSFSLKESSTIPQLISTYVTVKSGPIKSEASGSPDNANREKAQGHSRGRSSPLRRLLDPLLKPKAPNLRSADTGLVERNLNCASINPIDASGPVPQVQQGTSVVHALLQFTVKNGLPLFKFVGENDSDILATTVKRFTESGKDDSSWIYTFYSVREIKKKKSGWMNQGSKGKSCGYAYNIIGQMKVSSSKEQNLGKESILFGSELERANQRTNVGVPNRELAAIVTSCRDTSCNGKESNTKRDSKKGFTEVECLTEDGCFCTSEDRLNNSTTVILPDGIHGLPKEGAPSPLIDRWKSGGLCDCGGWDIGCKLKVLASQKACCKVLEQYKTSPNMNRFDLFVQGGVRENKPVFSLAPMKSGIYSVKFSASISLLQAFSICVAVMNNLKSDHLGASHQSEVQKIQEPTPTGVDKPSPVEIQGESPVRYVPYPPYSPIGRV